MDVSPDDANESVPQPPPIWSQAAIDVARDELKFHHDRIAAGSDSVTTIGQNIFILVGAGALIATQVREGVVLVPLFWSAWLLHSLQRSRDSLKHQVYARSLEAHINRAVGASVLAWNRSLTTNRLNPLITDANFAYWGLLNLGSWVTAFAVLANRGHRVAAIALVAVFVAVVGAAIQNVLTDKRFEMACQSAIEEALENNGRLHWGMRYRKSISGIDDHEPAPQQRALRRRST